METKPTEKLLETAAQKVWDDEAKIEIHPPEHVNEGSFEPKFTLYIGTEDCGIFPTYTQALEHAIRLVNDVDFGEV